MDRLADSYLAEGSVEDPWVDGRLRFRAEPCLLSRDQAGLLAEAAAALALVLDEIAGIARERPDEIADFLGLSPARRVLARLDQGRWLGLARADVFFCDDARWPQVCEINSDTPTGLAETVAGSRIAAADHPSCLDPSAALRSRWLDYARLSLPEAKQRKSRPLAGLIYPTEMPEDLLHLRLLASWLRDDGWDCVFGSPFNLDSGPDGEARLFGQPLDLVIRHYKTDWWTERDSLWRDEAPPADAAPLDAPITVLCRAQLAGFCSVINPWGTVVTQNKRVLALPFECPELFQPDTLKLARRHLPESRRLESLPLPQVLAERESWVLKSDYGCEGEEVFLGRDCSDAEWAAALSAAAPGRWLLQRAFRPTTNAEGQTANHGVFLIAGRPSGIFTRFSNGATDGSAVAAPTLIRNERVERLESPSP
ncbi:MAG: hypothetical protein RL095_1850 [Verrucomicrobiota bacterium]|jgi:hypothetical protein